jgi:glyceraldehyde 3-phosphate dehydrogenase
MKKIKVAVNGCGRIGRAFIKLASKKQEIELVAINDLGDINNIAYLLRYDSAYGVSDLDVLVSKSGKEIVLNGKEVSFFSEKDPSLLPWGKLGVDMAHVAAQIITGVGFIGAHLL